MPGVGRHSEAAGRRPPAELSVVLVGEPGPRLSATLAGLGRQKLGGRRVELVVTRPWPGPPLPPWEPREPFELRVVDVLVPSATAMANAGLAATEGAALLLLAAGDLPETDDLLARHLDGLGPGWGSAVGAVRGEDPVRVGWIGAWPEHAPIPPARHLLLERAALTEAGGLDERLPDLEVAILDLLARLRAAGRPVIERPELVVQGPAWAPRASLARAAEAGRGARALAPLLGERGTPVRILGPRRARVTLRWCEPALRLAAGLAAGRARRPRTLAHRAAFARGLGGYPPPLEPTARGGLLPAAGGIERPPVSIVAPFAGRAEEGGALLDALGEVTRRPGDEVIVVDNSRTPVLAGRPGVSVVRADREWSSYHARNAGARAAAAPWILFVDADCRPAPWIIDAYFAPPPSETAGAVAGGVLGAPAGGWAARWSAAVEVLSQARSLGRDTRPYAVTANLLVRREALERLGGFAEGIRSGGDTELSWRLADEGWSIEHRPRAAVLHLHRSTFRGLIEQYRRYGSGAAWLGRRYPGALSGWPAFARSMFVAPLIDLAAGRIELSLMRATDLATTAAACVGGPRSNRPPGAPSVEACAVVAFAGAYPDEDQATRRERIAGVEGPVAIEARRRPRRIGPAGTSGDVTYAEDDATLDRLTALRWLAARPGGRRVVAAAAVRGRADLRALAGDAAVARRVAIRGAGGLVALDDDPGAIQALSRVRDLLGLPLVPSGVRASPGGAGGRPD